VDNHIIRYIHFLSVATLFFSYHGASAADVLPGNSEIADVSFSFAVQGHVSDEKTGRFFLAAGPQSGGAEQVKDFAVSVAIPFEQNKYRFEPLVPQSVHINGSKETLPNPLFDTGIEHIGLVSGAVINYQSQPIVVRSVEPSSLYFFESILPPKTGSLVWVPYVPDANGQVNGGIVGLSRSTADYSFVAVKPHQNNIFGALGSGIALFVLGMSEIEVEVEDKSAVVKSDSAETKEVEKENIKPQIVKKTVLNVRFDDAPTGDNRRYPRALPFDITSEQLKIGNNLAGMGQIVDIHWDNTIARLYIALQITTGSEMTDGGRALVVGRVHRSTFENSDKRVVEKRTLVLEKIAPDDAFNNVHNNIVGSIGANAHVSLHKVRTMFTSTGLHYVVVLGGNGDSDVTKRSVHALPIVSNSSRPSCNGTLASKNAIPVDEFHASKLGVPNQFVRRDIKQPAIVQDDMVLATDAAARVGVGPIEAGDITDVFVHGDAVFATVGTPKNSNE